MTTLDSCQSPQCSAPLMAEELQERQDEAVLDQLPPCMNVVKTVRGLEVTYRSSRMKAFAVLFFALLWNGILYTSLPALGSKVALVVQLLSIPLMLAGIFLLMEAVYLVFGRVKLTLNPGQGELFHGIGSWGRRRKFSLGRNVRISIEEADIQKNGEMVKEIVVEQPEGRPFFFGTDMAEEGVLDYMAALLRKMRE